MKLIADGGSTKTEWCLCDNGQLIKRIFTGGINPYILDDKQILHILNESLLSQTEADRVSEIHFYGAGCRDAVVPRMKKLFAEVFTSARSVCVYSDLLASARALFGNERGIACILGTGANSCYYDGDKIAEATPAMGFILGDEGSGADIGRHLLNAIYKRRMPSEISKKFDETYGLSLDDIIARTYRAPEPGKFLASFTRFVGDNIRYPELQTLVLQCFRRFFTNNILPYGDKHCRLAAIGSVAFYFHDILNRAAEAEGYSMYRVLQSPMPGLLKYHGVLTTDNNIQ